MIYDQTNISENEFIRFFSHDIDSKELVWHRDKETRLVEVLENTDWKFQMDNKLPITLSKGVKFKIPKGTFHRVIKGSDSLKIRIKEI